MEGSENLADNDRGLLLKRKDYIGVDQNAEAHPHRHYFRKHVDLDEVIAMCSKKLQLDPYNVKALFLRGHSYFKKRVYNKALEDFSNAIRNDPKHIESLYYRGMTHSKLEKQPEAIKDLSQVLQINPDHVNAAFARAACFNTIGQFSQAIEDYNFALLKDQNPMSREDRAASISLKSTEGGGGSGGGGFDSPFSPFTVGTSGGGLGDDNASMFSPARSTHLGTGNGVTSPSQQSVTSAFTTKGGARGGVTGPSTGPFTPVSRNNNPNNGFNNANSDNATVSGMSAGSLAPSTVAPAAKPKSAKTLAADEHHARGYQLRRNGDFAGAIAAYTQAIASDGEHFKAFFNRGFAYDKLSQFDKAVADYSRSIEIDPVNAFAYYNRGISLDRMGSLESALLDFSRAIELQPNTADFYHNRAFCFRKLDRIREAVEDYSQSLRIVPTHFKALFNRACCLEQLGQAEAALKDYNAALNIQPNHLGCLMNRAAILEQQDQLEESLKDYTQALVYGGDPHAVFSGRSKVLSRLNRFAEAVQDITAALISKPQPVDGNLLYSRAVCYQSLEDFPKAVDDFTASLAVNPTNAQAYNNRGYCYRKLEKFEAAIADYEQSIRIQPDNVRAYNNRAYIFAKLNRFEEAIEDYSMVIQLNPGNSHAYHNRGISYDKMGLFDQAIADFTKVLELDSGSPTTVPPTAPVLPTGSVPTAQRGAAGSPRAITATTAAASAVGGDMRPQHSQPPLSPMNLNQTVVAGGNANRATTPTIVRSTTPSNAGAGRSVTPNALSNGGSASLAASGGSGMNQFKMASGTFHASRTMLNKSSPDEIRKFGANHGNTSSMAPSGAVSAAGPAPGDRTVSPAAIRRVAPTSAVVAPSMPPNPPVVNASGNSGLILKPTPVVSNPLPVVANGATSASAPAAVDDIAQRLSRVGGILQDFGGAGASGVNGMNGGASAAASGGSSVAAVAARLAERRSKTPTPVVRNDAVPAPVQSAGSVNTALAPPTQPQPVVPGFNPGSSGGNHMSVKSFLASSGGGGSFSYPEVPSSANVPPTVAPSTIGTTGPRQSKWLTRSMENSSNTSSGEVAPTAGGSGVVLQPQIARPLSMGSVAPPSAPPSGPINAAAFLSNLKQQQQQQSVPSTPVSSAPPSHPGYPTNVAYTMVSSPAVGGDSAVSASGAGVGLISASKGKFSQPSVYSGAR